MGQGYRRGESRRQGRVLFRPRRLAEHGRDRARIREKYGITAEFLDLRISEIRERMRAEQIAGRVIGDVLTTSFNVTTSIENNEGYIQPLKPFPAKSRVRGRFEDRQSVGHAGAGLYAEVRHPGEHAAR